MQSHASLLLSMCNNGSRYPLACVRGSDRCCRPEPGTTNQGPRTGNEERTRNHTKNQEPGRKPAARTKHQEPGTKNQGPQTKNQEPGPRPGARTKNHEPRTKNQESGAENQEPRTKNPRTRNPEPRTRNQEPTATQRRRPRTELQGSVDEEISPLRPERLKKVTEAM